MSKQTTLFRHIRKAAGLLQEDVAEALGVTQATISRWDSGAIKAPDSAIESLRAMLVSKAA